MIIDHIGFYLWLDNPWYRLLGRGAAPLFFFLIGFDGKLRVTPLLCLYGLILTITAFVVNHFSQINILLYFIAIYYLIKTFPIERIGLLGRALSFIIIIILNIFVYDYIEYGLLGILIAYSGRLIALNDKQGPVWLMLVLIYYFLWECLFFQFTAQPALLYSFAVLILCLYFLMSQYQLKTLACPPWLLMPSLVVSRYSLEIYFYHLILLQCYRFLHLGKYFVK